MKAVVFGSRGLVGRHLVDELKQNRWELVEPNVPVSEYSRLYNLLLPVRADIDVIFNAVGLASVQGCEKNPQEAFRVNALGAENIARYAESIGATMVHVSTEYVFDGNATYNSEVHETYPYSVYAQSKRLGEILVANACKKHHIVRLQQLYGKGGKNLLSKIATGQTISEMVDHHRRIAPMWSGDAARILSTLGLNDRYGLWHATARGSTTYYDFATHVNPKGDWKFGTFGGPPILLECHRWSMYGFRKLPTWQESFAEFQRSVR